MITIHKFPIQMTELFQIIMPAGALMLHVDVQRGAPQLWARVDTKQPDRSYDFGVFGTGHDMEADVNGRMNLIAYAPHVGSFMLQGDSLVFHLFGGLYTK